MSFFGRFLTKVKFFFWSIAQIERGFQKLGHLVTKIVCLKIFEFLKVTVKIYVKSRLESAPRPKNFKFAPIRNLHHFASKKVPHNVSQILRVTEIQQFRWNQLLTKNR